MDERKYVDAVEQDLLQRKADFKKKVADVYVLVANRSLCAMMCASLPLTPMLAIFFTDDRCLWSLDSTEAC